MPYEPLLHIVLHEPEIPQNTGNIGRTCVAVAAKLWLVRPLGFRLDESRLKRAGMDYWDHLVWEVVDTWDQLQERLPIDRRWLFSRFAEKNYTEAHFATGDVLVFGSETRGLPRSWIVDQPTSALRIPMRPEARSLNLACSVAVAAYEATRQIAVNSARR